MSKEMPYNCEYEGLREEMLLTFEVLETAAMGIADLFSNTFRHTILTPEENVQVIRHALIKALGEFDPLSNMKLPEYISQAVERDLITAYAQKAIMLSKILC